MKPSEGHDRLAVIDLFSGSGGLSHGFDLYNRNGALGGENPRVRFEVVAGLEIEPRAVETFYLNHPDASRAYAKPTDLTKVRGKDMLRNLELREVAVIVGGPPCQGFSHAGPRNPNDQRNELVFHFQRLVDETRPLYFIMENVPGLLRSKKSGEDPFMRQLLNRFKDLGYLTSLHELNAMDYGVPQKRKRVVLVGNRLGIVVATPSPTHSDQVDYLMKRKPYVTVGEAILDLPSPTYDEPQSYGKTPHSDYAKFMRAGSSAVYNHTPAKHGAAIVQKMKHQEQGTRLYEGWNHAWVRLHSKRPSPTIKENHRAPAVHPVENRVITPRECARLQSFPDSFVFAGTKSSQLTQIGNAVPPLLGRALAQAVAEGLAKA